MFSLQTQKSDETRGSDAMADRRPGAVTSDQWPPTLSTNLSVEIMTLILSICFDEPVY